MPYGHPHDMMRAADGFAAPLCDDQLPVLSRVGRGLKGNGAFLRISEDSDDDELYLEGGEYDEASKTENILWKSENVNGGRLQIFHNVRRDTTPATFTITFNYSRPHIVDGQDDGAWSWSWTTPPIPYVVDYDNPGDLDDVVGAGVATLYLQTKDNYGQWAEPVEILNYPDLPSGKDPHDVFNTPDPDEPWAALLRVGAGGDLELPSFADLARIFGDMQPSELLAFCRGTGSFPWDVPDQYDRNVKGYIDSLENRIEALENANNDLRNALDNFRKSMSDLVFGVGFAGWRSAPLAFGDIIWDQHIIEQGMAPDPSTGAFKLYIPMGNINIWSGSEALASEDTSWISGLRARSMHDPDGDSYPCSDDLIFR